MLIAMRIRNMPMPAKISSLIVPITISIMLIEFLLIVEFPACRHFHQAGRVSVCVWQSGFSLSGKQRPGYQGTHTSSL
jgi:hypothetical protein